MIRFARSTLGIGVAAAFILAAPATMADPSAGPAKSKTAKSSSGQVEVTADQSLEWYQDQRLYVARGNAKAVRGETVIDADLLTAHQREEPKTAKGAAKPKAAAPNGSPSGSGEIDKMTAEGHVRITDPRQRVSGDHAVYDLDKHVAVVTGSNLKYETEKETVTAKNSLEYWEDKKIAVARGNAVADGKGRHVEGDVLTAEFRDTPAGEQEMWKMTAEGNVTVVTATDVTRGDRGVFDVSRNIAVVSGNVRITRNDGTQLAGDVGEVDFKTNQSRLMNNGHTRVRALLVSHDDKTADATPDNPAGAQ